MRKKNFVFMFFVVLAFFCCSLEAKEVAGYSIYPKIETPHPYPSMENGAVVWSETIYQEGATWLKIHLSDFEIKKKDYLKVIDNDGKIVFQLEGSEVSTKSKSVLKFKWDANGRCGFWLPALKGDRLRVELHQGDKGKEKWGFVIDEVGVGVQMLSYDERFDDESLVQVQSICQSNDLWDIACFSGTTYYDKGQSVGRMIYQENGAWYMGTGFLISCNNTNHFMTTYSHISTQALVDNLEVQFYYQYSTCNGSDPITGVATVFGDVLVDYSSFYGFALLTLTSRPVGSIPLTPLSRQPVTNENIYIVQHPYGGVKKIGIGNIFTLWTSSFTYYIDTVGESHGAPIIVPGTHQVIGMDVVGNCPNIGVKMASIYSRIRNYIGCN